MTLRGATGPASGVARPRFSVVVPAHNEEVLLPAGLAAIGAAAEQVPGEVETVVVANRCSDATEEVAQRAGARVVESEVRNIAAVRNAGAAAAAGDVIVTVDADCLMAPTTFRSIGAKLATGRYVGGATKVRPERMSAGIRATLAVVDLAMLLSRLGGGMFWCRREDFEAVGGFDESLLLAEDMDFARRLKAHGRRTGRRFTVLRDAPLVSSCRKFDAYGDWHMFRMAFHVREIRAAWRGADTAWADRYFFDFNS
jgi:glycosyltransferase involved in cell wall biosynthesis